MTPPRSFRESADGIAVAIGTAGLAVALWPALLMLAAPGPIMLVPLVAHVSGMLAGYGVLVLLVLMSRWPVLERGLGSDRLARWHALGGRAVLALVLTHAVAAVLGGARPPGCRRGPRWWTSWRCRGWSPRRSARC